MRQKAQKTLIFEYLSAGNSITPVEALNRFGCFRLSARIKELKDNGCDIVCDMVKTKNGARVASYHFANAEKRKKSFIQKIFNK